MDSEDVEGNDLHKARGAGGLKREEEMQALLDSVSKYERMKSKSSISLLSSGFPSKDGLHQLDAAKFSKACNTERNTLSAGLLMVLDATRSSTSPTPSEADVRSHENHGHGDLPPAAEGGDPVCTIPGVEEPPQGQDAEKIEGYDPSRIPASIFVEKSSLSSMDWSLASNESLFSIRMDSCRFSRDHLTSHSEELGSLSHSPLATDPSDSPLPLSIDPQEVHLVAGKDPEKVAAAQEVNAETMADILRAAAGEYGENFLSPDEDTASSAGNQRPSDGSSVHSFAFPILTKANVALKVVPEQHPTTQWQNNPRGEKRITVHHKPHHCRWFQCFSCSLCHTD